VVNFVVAASTNPLSFLSSESSGGIHFSWFFNVVYCKLSEFSAVLTDRIFQLSHVQLLVFCLLVVCVCGLLPE
jgi:hypothetical protein